MNWKINIFCLFLLFSACTSAPETEWKGEDYLIEAEELLTVYETNGVKIIDFRREASYQQAHIPGALNVWRPDIEDDSRTIAGMMAPKEKIETVFSRLGVRSNDQLIVYDDRGGCDAARLWWVFQNYGLKNLRILNGGIEAWKKAGGMVSNEDVELPVSEFSLPAENQNRMLIGKEELTKKLESGENIRVLDVRSKEEFSGEMMKAGALKPGRIPGSTHFEWTTALNERDCLKLKSTQKLDSLYAGLNIEHDELIVVYCHSGVRSAHTAFVLTELLGYQNVKNYDGSWTEWSQDDRLPVESDIAN